MLDELYDDHLGVTKIKALARSYVWWPGIVKTVQRLPTHPEQSQNCTAPLMGVASTPLAAHLRLFGGTILGNDVSSCRGCAL